MPQTQKVARATIDGIKAALGVDANMTRSVSIYPRVVLVERVETDASGDAVIENGEARIVQDTYDIDEEAPGDGDH